MNKYGWCKSALDLEPYFTLCHICVVCPQTSDAPVRYIEIPLGRSIQVISKASGKMESQP